MNTFATIGELKYRAKNHLTGKFGIAINAMITVQLIVSGISILVNMACDQNSVSGLVMYYLIQILITILLGLFTSGQCFLYLNMCCDKPIEPSMIYYGFKSQPEKAVLIQVLQMLLYMATMIPGGIMIAMGIWMKQAAYIQIGGLLLIASGVAVAFLGICFAQAFYLLHDFPNYSAKELLLMSYKIMNGYKWKLFLLLLSFIPLLLASLLTFGIGLLWVEPYMNATATEFFLELMRHREK